MVKTRKIDDGTEPQTGSTQRIKDLIWVRSETGRPQAATKNPKEGYKP